MATIHKTRSTSDTVFDKNSYSENTAKTCDHKEIFTLIMAKLDSIEHQHHILQQDLIRTEEHFIEQTKNHTNKLGHAVDHLLKDKEQTYDIRACREMISSIIEKDQRPFDGQTIVDRERRERLQRYCFFVIFPIMFGIWACVSFYLNYSKI